MIKSMFGKTVPGFSIMWFLTFWQPKYPDAKASLS